MQENDITVWGIHAGKTGDAHTLFMSQNVIALGWPLLGDLSKIKGDRETFKAKIIEAYPGKKPGAVPVDAGQLFRFIYELKKGDIVVYPSKVTREIHIGKVVGDYQYSPDLHEHYRNTRAVKWLKVVPRINLTQGALYEIGSAMSFFQVKTYAEEFLAAIKGKTVPAPPEEDETVGPVVEEIEQTTRDFIMKQLAQEMKGHPLAHFFGHILEKMGYYTRVSPEGSDGGIDIIAHKDELGFEPPIIKVQVKSGQGSTGDPEVSQLKGKLGTGEFGLFVSLSPFTPKAKAYAQGISNLRLIDGNDLVDLILLHYEEFDPRYKALIPLKHVYIPEVLTETA